MQYPAKTAKWGDVLDRLRSGEVLQTQGAMCRLNPDGVPAYCPLGLIALLSGADFQLHSGIDIMCDDNGEEGVPDWGVLEALGLTEYVTEEEMDAVWEYKTALLWKYEGEVRRYELIAFLNDDMGLRFEKIADEIERLGWNDHCTT